MLAFHKRRYIVLVLSIMFLGFNNLLRGQTNEGKEFWFGFMEHFDVNNNVKVAMITSKFNTTGSISIPHRNWEQNFAVTANNVTIISLPNYTENLGSEVYNDVGVHISTREPSSVYIHQFHEFRSEAAVVLPVSTIGSSYFTMTYRAVLNRGNVYPSEFLIVGTQDETVIDITLSDETKGGLEAGFSYQITLDKGETYQVQSASASGDLTGSKLIGDKDFALFGGNSWTEVPNGCSARDNLLEQMYPVETWGTKIVTVPNASVSYDVVRILASENNTKVKILGDASLSEVVIDQAKFVEYNFTEAKFISSDKPIQVAQFNVGESCGGHSIGDPSMVLLNSVEQTRDTVTLFNSSLQGILENYINIISLTSDLPFITFDGKEIPANAEIGTVGLNDEYSYIRLRVTAGAHTIISEACGVIATAYGYGPAESYAYSGGASFNTINSNPIPDGGCLNDTIFFDSNLPEQRYSVTWDLGNGKKSSLHSFEEFYPDLGSYSIELIVTDDCLGTIDTFTKELVVSLRQALTTLGDTVVCLNDSFTLGATDIDNATYEWTGPNGFFSDEQFPFIEDAELSMTGSYSVIGIVSGCATFPNYSEVGVWELPQPKLGNDSIFCNLKTQTILNPGSFVSYLWDDGSDLSDFEVHGGGIYGVIVKDENGCSNRDEVVLEEICPTEVFIPNVFSPNEDGVNDRFQVFGHDIIKMHLRIYDRWGNFIFETRNQNESWDGLHQGSEVGTGIYIWTLEIEGYRADGEIYQDILKGDFYLVK